MLFYQTLAFTIHAKTASHAKIINLKYQLRHGMQAYNEIFIKASRFLPFAKNIGKSIGESINKNLSGKYIQKVLDQAKQFSTDALKTVSKRVI